MWERLLREPALVASAIRSVLLCVVLFGVKLTDQQIVSVMLAVEAILTVLTRAVVTPNAKITNGTVTGIVVLLGSLFLAVPPAEANERISGGLSVGPVLVERSGSLEAGIAPRAWLGYSATDLVTGAVGIDHEITSSAPETIGFLGARLNLHRDRTWRVAAGLEGTYAVQGEDEWSSRALFVGTRILSRGTDGRPLWSVKLTPSLDLEHDSKVEWRLALDWHAIRGGN